MGEYMPPSVLKTESPAYATICNIRYTTIYSSREEGISYDRKA